MFEFMILLSGIFMNDVVRQERGFNWDYSVSRQLAEWAFIHISCHGNAWLLSNLHLISTAIISSRNKFSILPSAARLLNTL